MFCSKANIPTLVSIFLLIIVVFLVYADTLRYDFVWDDEDLIQKNTRIRSLGDLSTFFEVEPF
jgi:hypothetical protein